MALARAKFVPKLVPRRCVRYLVTKSRPFGSELGTLPMQACQALPRIRPVHQAFRAFPIRDD
jgi:hypothetical protein